MLQQRLVSRLTALHRREARHPQLDDVGLAVEVFHQLAKRELGQRRVILLTDRHPGDLTAHRGIEHRHFDPGIHRLLHQGGGIRVTPLGENNAIVFLADGLVDEVLEFGVIAVAQEGADFETELFAFLQRPGDKLGGVIVRPEVADHGNADRAVVFGNRRRHRRRGGGQRRRRLQQTQRHQRECDLFHAVYPVKC